MNLIIPYIKQIVKTKKKTKILKELAEKVIEKGVPEEIEKL